MGSATIQGALWGKNVKNWVSIQEPTVNDGYFYVLDHLKLKPGMQLLDVGCGTGLFCKLAATAGAKVTGFDASENLLNEAKQQVTSVDFLHGEMEELPFTDNQFDVICGFNSFQYAANVKNALTEAKRVLKPGGKLAVMIWGNKADCEAATYLKAVGSLLPPPPPGAPGPFALSENQLLEQILLEIGLKITDNEDVTSIWDYPDADTALKGLMSAGPVARAMEHHSFETVHATILEAVKPYLQHNGHVVYHNKLRVVIAGK